KGTTVTDEAGRKGATPERPVLARDSLRYVGEAVAMVVADTVEAARDALEQIGFDYEDAPAKLDLAPGGGTVHAEAPDNRAYGFGLGDAQGVEAALAGSAHVVDLEVIHNRVIVNAMEPRAAFAEWDGARLHVCVNGQGVWVQKAELARMLGLDREAVRVTNPDVGGGFGMKAMTYPEYVVLAHAARVLGHPVRWISERTEAMLTDNGARDLVARLRLGFDENFKITAYHVDVTSNMGAYNSQEGQIIQSELFAKVLTGPYDIRLARLTACGIYTNTTPMDAYRGAGRPEAILTMERAMDHAARVLGVDPFDLRQRNFISEFPYRMVNGELVDVGDFAIVLNRLKREADVGSYAARQADSAARGRLRGMGLACYIETVLGDPSETAAVSFDEDGGVSLYVGTQSNGQGHETVYTRMLAERTGISDHLIRIVQGDSDLIAKGGGTGGSRSVTTQGMAIGAVAGGMVEAFSAFLEPDLGPEVAFAEGRFGAPGSNLRLTLIEAAERARAAGRSDLLRHSRTTSLPGRSFPNGAHLAEVEIDPETGALTLDRYTVTDDFGTLINPQLVEGQVHGGIAQGFGQAVLENAAYDEQGQLLTASFMDYAMPRAQDFPLIRFTTESVPSTNNPLGMKGCGEAGTVGSLGAVSNAVADALAGAGVVRVDMPFTPHRIWSWLQEAGRKE
ncbi:MAG: xanthine dehydrogenase family protein molybdopterin-binding subunit, partial [Pseudorhodobacter sp.]